MKKGTKAAPGGKAKPKPPMPKGGKKRPGC